MQVYKQSILLNNVIHVLQCIGKVTQRLFKDFRFQNGYRPMSEGRFVALSTKILNMKYPKLNPLIYFLSVSSTQISSPLATSSGT